jgi:hypothetical protein
MSDLPEIHNGQKREEIPYGGEPMSHFQRLVSNLKLAVDCEIYIGLVLFYYLGV